ncbi:MAG: thioredoxin fold domain-containing protein [Deltaproteobacteria bacterium]|nr:MAG: thioredoxin fold domain-containing protein [Deltaproteobacteria bacterium]
MRLFRWVTTLVIISSFILATSACTRNESGRQKAKSAPSGRQEGSQIKWVDFNDGLIRATKDNKPMFLEFYTDWCVACKEFHRKILQNQKVAEMLADNFISVRLNAEDSRNHVKYNGESFSNVDLSRSFGVMAYPSLVFMEPGGQPITLIPGFVPAAQFLAILDYIHQRCYVKEISIHEFVKKGSCS